MPLQLHSDTVESNCHSDHVLVRGAVDRSHYVTFLQQRVDMINANHYQGVEKSSTMRKLDVSKVPGGHRDSEPVDVGSPSFGEDKQNAAYWWKHTCLALGSL